MDIVLFPLDTIKTRLQSQQGFLKSGGFRGVYRGLGPQVVGSAPQAALFFCTYESFKHFASPLVPSYGLPFVHMLGASMAEVVACLIRVPMEVVKQRRQVSAHKSSYRILTHAIRSEGIVNGLYRGFGSTILREIPFAFVQFPTLEFLKSLYRSNFKNNIPLESWEVAVCGSVAGGFAAACTTPLDVVKTRIMLADKSVLDLRISTMFLSIYREKGIAGLFAGFAPRVLWMFLGGYIFFGSYDFAKKFCNDYLLDSEYETTI